MINFSAGFVEILKRFLLTYDFVFFVLWDRIAPKNDKYSLKSGQVIIGMG